MRFGQTIDARLQALEDAQRQLARSTSQLPERLAGQRVKIQSRLAITVDDPNTATYPEASANPNTYFIKFLDSTFDNSDDGDQALTTNNRQATAPTVVRNLRTSYLPEGTKLWVFQFQERWYTSWSSGTVIGVFYLDEPMPQRGSAEATQCEFVGGAWVPGGGDPVTVYDTVGSGPSYQTDLVICWQSEESGRWEIIEAPAQNGPLVGFYLDADLAKGGSAAATLLVPSGGLTATWTADGDSVTVHDVIGRFGPAKQTRRGIAAQIKVDNNPANDVYLVFNLDKDAIALYLFYLTGALTKGGSALATIREWDTVGSDWDATGGAATVYDSSSLGPCAAGTDDNKESGVAWLNPDSGRYEIITLKTTPSGTLIPFRLYENLNYGGFADAILLEWDDVDSEWVPSADHITVWDSFHVGPRIAQYDGWAQLDPNSGNYEVVSLSRPALPLNIQFSVEEDFTNNTLLIVGDVMHSWDGPDYAIANAGADVPTRVVVHNVERLDDSKGKYVFKGKTNSMGYAKYNPDLNRYEAVWVECPDEAINESMSQGGQGGDSPGGDAGVFGPPVVSYGSGGAPFI